MDGNDRDWMYYAPRWGQEYIDKVNEFLSKAFETAAIGEEVCCPCRDCCNRYWYHRNVVYNHLVSRGFVKAYWRWIFHGEKLQSKMHTDAVNVHGEGNDHSCDHIVGMLHDVVREATKCLEGNLEEGVRDEQTTNAEKFHRLVEKQPQELHADVSKQQKEMMQLRPQLKHQEQMVQSQQRPHTQQRKRSRQQHQRQLQQQHSTKQQQLQQQCQKQQQQPQLEQLQNKNANSKDRPFCPLDYIPNILRKKSQQQLRKRTLDKDGERFVDKTCDDHMEQELQTLNEDGERLVDKTRDDHMEQELQTLNEDGERLVDETHDDRMEQEWRTLNEDGERLVDETHDDRMEQELREDGESNTFEPELGDGEAEPSNSNQTTSQQCDSIASQDASNSRRKRGPTTCVDIHARTLDMRTPIILNEKNQPIGPDDGSLRRFSSFLGTLARDSSFCPLDKPTWRQINDEKKSRLWKYVNEKWLIPSSGEKWVLSTIRECWKCYKCRLREKYYEKYPNDKVRLRNRPDTIPIDQFRALLKYWGSERGKELSQKNKVNRAKQVDTHTTGPTSFARIRKNLQEKNPNQEEPSTAEMYIETRKKKKVEQNEHKKRKIEQLQQIGLHDGDDNVKDATIVELLGGVRPGRVLLEGRGVTPTQLKMKRMIGGSSIQASESFIDSIKEKLEIQMLKKLAVREEEMRREMREEIENLRREITHGFVKVLSQIGVNIDSAMLESFMAPSPEDASSGPAHARMMSPHSSTGTNDPLNEE
ncbi:hypothetical protein Ancab_039946 [Ancistrocladus abbreviatus]